MTGKYPAEKTSGKRPSRLRAALRTTGTMALTFGFLVGAAVLVVLGRETLANAAERGPTTAAAPLAPVADITVTTEPGYTIHRRFTGQIESALRSDVAFESGGLITEVLVEEGDLVRAGQTLAQLDTTALLPQRAALQAQRDALAADAELAELDLRRSTRLADAGHRSVAAQDEARLRLARTWANIAALEAQIAGVNVQIAKSRLVAPFDARVGARLADPGQTVGAGQGVLALFDRQPARLRVGLPPELATTLAVGDSLSVMIADQPVTASVMAIRPDLDPSTRSRAVLLTLPDDLPALYGETADLWLSQSIAEPGFWAPLAALREGARGSWTVLALTAEVDGDRVIPAAVEVIHATADRVFLRGNLPPGGRIVATGTHRVAPGQVVLAQITSDPQE